MDPPLAPNSTKDSGNEMAGNHSREAAEQKIPDRVSRLASDHQARPTLLGSQTKPAGRVSYAAATAVAPAMQWTMIQRKKTTKEPGRPGPAKSPAIDL